MNQQRKNMIYRNEPFVCKHCSYENTPTSKVPRNHCMKCLYSLHVDNIPGDRESQCMGLMKPIGIHGTYENAQIVFLCEICYTKKKNKKAKDDNPEIFRELLSKPLSP
jgi:ribosome biogenesis GTPase / thiamine phosphate phosphatase